MADALAANRNCSTAQAWRAFGIAAEFGRGEAVEGDVVRGMYGDELTLEVRREFRDREAVVGDDAADGLRVGFALGGAFEIEQSRVPSGDLHAFVAELGGPRADVVQRVEWRVVTCKLREKNGGSLDRFHSLAPTCVYGEILGGAF